jgi:regulation of enolase protein 1 (concanavalin A-like superfamily)
MSVPRQAANWTEADWDEASWTDQPVAVTTTATGTLVEAQNGSDFWEQTLYGFEHRNGHALLAPWPQDEAIEVSFTVGSLTELYDQAGLMIRLSVDHWIKAGIEMNDGVPHLGAVVTNQHSDWSLGPVPEWADATVTIRASRIADAVVIRARASDGPWRTVRVAPFDTAAKLSAGPMLCAPTRAGFVANFTGWQRTAADVELHAEPPIQA